VSSVISNTSSHNLSLILGNLQGIRTIKSACKAAT
jgi:hypothetical protein